MAQPFVPIVPGVPALIQALPVPIPIALTQDLVADPLSAGRPRWGIYKAGAPVIAFDTFVSIDYRQGWSISDFPLEQGAFESYDKVALPFDVRVKFASGGNLRNRQLLLESIAAISNTLDLYDVVTPEKTYTSVNVQHYDYRRTATNGVGLITIEVWLLEIRTRVGASAVQTGAANATQGTGTSDATAQPFVSSAPPLTNTVDPSGTSSFNGGIVQGIPVPSNDAQFNVLPP